ncbi:MAG TPA: hypothetical protein VGQ20_03110 [Acidimicrobiales bacterium]|nr:hypothetical protein [Acidimicrobiales bacterium]
MSDASKVRSRSYINAVVRLRCNACEVAWSGPTTSPCWVCGTDGTPLNTLLSSRDQAVSAFDLDLLV